MRMILRSEIALCALLLSAAGCGDKSDTKGNSSGSGGTDSNGGSANGSGGTADGGGNARGGVNSDSGGTNSGSGGASAGGAKASSGGVKSSSGGAKSSSGGASASTGGATASMGGTSASMGGGAAGGSNGGMNACGALTEHLSAVTVTAPEGVKPGVRNYRIWGSTSLNISPVFTAPLANCGTLVCYTTGTGQGSSGTRHARVARFDKDDQLVTTYDLGAYECRGLAAEPDGHFGALLWAPGTATDCMDFTTSGRIYVSRFDGEGMALFSTELTNTSTSGLGPNCPTDFGIGESRLEFGGGKYGAYYHVHSKSGHEGDTLKYVDTAGTESTIWSWGCSHSMSNVLRFNPADSKFMPACVTDCYPGTDGSDFATVSIGGIYINNKNKVMDVDGGCNGSVAGELGGGAIAPSGWKIVFNAHQNPAMHGDSTYSSSTMNQDIGFASIASGLTSGAVVWLTTTPSIQEADSSIERFKSACEDTEQYLVGWSEPGTAYKYKLGRVNAMGAFIENPVDVTSLAKWGRRDDPFRAHVNGDIVWAWFDSAGGTALHLARVRSGGSAQCASF